MSGLADLMDRLTSGEGCLACGARLLERQDCQQLFEEVLAREFSDDRYGRLHRLTVDTYALQHPERYMRSGKSFAAHLTGMSAALDYDQGDILNRQIQRWLNGARDIERPEEPSPGQRGELTIMHVHSAASPEEHLDRVREWARSTWSAWKGHHHLARQWIESATRMAEGR